MAAIVLKWRKWARMVAYLDLIGSIMIWLPAVTFSLFSGFVTMCLMTPWLYDNDEEAHMILRKMLGDHENSLNTEQLKGRMLHRIWAVVITLGTFVGLQFWAATWLMRATEKGRNSKKALELCKIWRNVSILLSLMLILVHFGIRNGPVKARLADMLESHVTLLVPLLIRELFSFIVSRYMMELEPQQPRVYKRMPVFKETMDNIGEVKVNDKLFKGDADMTKVIVI